MLIAVFLNKIEFSIRVQHFQCLKLQKIKKLELLKFQIIFMQIFSKMHFQKDQINLNLKILFAYSWSHSSKIIHSKFDEFIRTLKYSISRANIISRSFIQIFARALWIHFRFENTKSIWHFCTRIQKHFSSKVSDYQTKKREKVENYRKELIKVN